jgi:hypothetical protein
MHKYVQSTQKSRMFPCFWDIHTSVKHDTPKRICATYERNCCLHQYIYVYIHTHYVSTLGSKCLAHVRVHIARVSQKQRQRQYVCLHIHTHTYTRMQHICPYTRTFYSRTHTGIHTHTHTHTHTHECCLLCAVDTN